MSSRYSARTRDRQQLFRETQSPSPGPSGPPTIAPVSAYPDESDRKRVNYSQEAQAMAQLEAQQDQTVDTMAAKIGTLRDLSLAMGHEINRSKDNLRALGEDMGITQERIRHEMARMKRFVELSGVPWKVWALFAVVICWFFFYSWLF